jgi:hypothetical protein
MRQDQFERLQLLSEKLLDVFLEEGDPSGWPGHGVKVAAMDVQTRGDRYWTKKNAAATGVLFAKVESMIGYTRDKGLGTTPAPDPEADADAAGESQLDAEIASAEREAAKLMKQLQGGATKADLKRVHGKA